MFYRIGHSRKPKRYLDRDAMRESDYRFRWNKGQPMSQQIPDPLRLQLLPLKRGDGDMGPFIAPMLDQRILLMHDDLIATLGRVNVNGITINNLQTFPIELLDPDNGQIHTDFKAVNILGCIAAADLSTSKYEVSGGIPIIDTNYTKIVVDEKATQGLLLFREAANTGVILAHHGVRDHLISEGFITDKSGDQALQFDTVDDTMIL